jgi:putative Mn2+ efflux pump MntP
MVSLILISVSLAMDAFAVSVSSGICIHRLKRIHILRACFFFGLFQFFMPTAGWYLGSVFFLYINAWDHWIAFALLSFIGGKMIIEGIRKKDEKDPRDISVDIRKFWVLVHLAVATSIDALAVGISFAVLEDGQPGFLNSIWFRASVIGGITFFICLIGFEFGRRIGFLFGKWAECAGGLILVGIGGRILIEHLSAGIL